MSLIDQDGNGIMFHSSIIPKKISIATKFSKAKEKEECTAVHLTRNATQPFVTNKSYIILNLLHEYSLCYSIDNLAT